MDESTDSEQKITRIALIAGVILYGSALCLWAVLLGLLLLSYTFDDVPFVYSALICYPVAVIGTLALSLILYTRSRYRESLVLLLIPLLCSLVTFGSYLWLWFNP